MSKFQMLDSQEALPSTEKCCSTNKRRDRKRQGELTLTLKPQELKGKTSFHSLKKDLTLDGIFIFFSAQLMIIVEISLSSTSWFLVGYGGDCEIHPNEIRPMTHCTGGTSHVLLAGCLDLGTLSSCHMKAPSQMTEIFFLWVSAASHHLASITSGWGCLFMGQCPYYVQPWHLQLAPRITFILLCNTFVWPTFLLLLCVYV